MAGEGVLGGTEGMGEARQAFESVMDSETPSRSKQGRESKEPERVDLETLFPRREMDRREQEGGLAEGEPAAVKRARAEARQQPGAEPLEDEDGEPKQRKRFKRPVEEDTHREPTEDDDDDDDLPEGDEDDGEDDGEQPDPDDDEDDDDDSDVGPLNLDAEVEVTIDGKPAKVSLKEAVKGYIRTETFHRRMGELQQGVTALTAARTELDGGRAALIERATALEEYVAAFMPQEPDWDAIYANDPSEGARMERKWRTFQGQIEGLREKREQTAHELERNRIQNLANFAAANRAKMVQAHPEWTKEKAWQRDHSSMLRTAKAVGYTDEEVNQLYDARGIEILLKAARYDRMMATKPKPVRNGFGNSTKANGSTPRHKGNVSRSFDRAEKRLSRTGSIRDAASVFEEILDHER